MQHKNGRQDIIKNIFDKDKLSAMLPAIDPNNDAPTSPNIASVLKIQAPAFGKASPAMDITPGQHILLNKPTIMHIIKDNMMFICKPISKYAMPARKQDTIKTLLKLIL